MSPSTRHWPRGSHGSEGLRDSHLPGATKRAPFSDEEGARFLVRFRYLRGGFNGSHSSRVVSKMWAPSTGMRVRSSITAP